MILAVAEDNVSMPEEIHLDAISDEIIGEYTIFEKYIQPKIDILEKKHHKIEALDLNKDKRLSDSEVVIATQTLSQEDRNDIKISMAEKQNEELAKNLQTNLQEFNDKIITTYVANPKAEIYSDHIAVLNLYLYLMKGEDVQINRDK